MTEWWSKDPVVSAPSQGRSWWEQDKVLLPAPASRQPNPFDLFDGPTAASAGRQPNPFDVFDAPRAKAAPDPIKAQVRQEIDAEKAGGRSQGMGAARTFVQGATLGTADEILAGLMTVPNMIKRRTLNPFTAYDYAKAKEDALLEDDRAASGLTGMATELLGGGTAGKVLYEAGATLGPAVASRLGGGLLGTATGAAADGVVLGAVQGAAEGSGWGRLEEAKKGAAIGGAFGGGIPLAAAGAGLIAAPLISNVSARMNPAAYAERQVARAAQESGQSADQIAARMQSAISDAQPEYRLIDALDNAGRRAGAVIAKNPGPGRQQLTEFLDSRQADQGYRVSNTLAEGLGATETAHAATNRMTTARQAMDDQAFSAVRSDAGAVDVTPALMRIDDTLRPSRAAGLNLENGIAYDSVEGALARARAILSDGRSQVTDFSVVQRARGDIADAVEKAHRAGEGNKARLLRQVRGELDEALENSSPGFRDAMAASREAARDINAVDAGTIAASRGRTEDKLAAFGALRPKAQQGFRTGYADPLIAKTQAAAEGVNKARPFTSQAMRTELPAFAVPGQGEHLMRRLGRENEMFVTRAKATGGSTTSENLADNAAAGIDMSIIGKLLGGEFFGAARHALNRAGAGLNGNTEAVRAAMARALLKGNPEEVRAMITRLPQAQLAQKQVRAVTTRGLTQGVTALVER